MHGDCLPRKAIDPVNHRTDRATVSTGDGSQRGTPDDFEIHPDEIYRNFHIVADTIRLAGKSLPAAQASGTWHRPADFGVVEAVMDAPDG